MKITFLGTGTSQGIPMVGCECEVCKSVDYRDQRLRASVHIETNGKSFVIDAGPDFRQQILRERIKKLDALILTHEHKDHIAGLDDVRGFNYLQRKPMPIYAHKRVIEHIKTREFYYAFGHYKYPGAPDIEVVEIDNKPFDIEGVTIIPIEVYHYKLPVFGFRIGDFTYITDANAISQIEEEKIKGSKVIVINGLQYEHHISHFTFNEALELLKKWNPEQGYFTHISHKLGKHQQIEKTLPPQFRLAYDGLKVEI
ncbi:MAG: MBL fold metallo-hydrolase [Cytophagales bacterium]